MKRLGILLVAGHNTRQISGGQLQRAAVCREMINRPDILFGDEPTGGAELLSNTGGHGYYFRYQ